MAIKRWNANTSQWELVGTPGTVTPASIGAVSLSGGNTIISQSASSIPLIIKAASSQTADLLEVLNSSNAELFAIRSGGRVKTSVISTESDSMTIGLFANTNSGSNGTSLILWGKDMGTWGGDVHYLVDSRGASGAHRFWTWDGTNYLHKVMIDSPGNLGINNMSPVGFNSSGKVLNITGTSANSGPSTIMQIGSSGTPGAGYAATEVFSLTNIQNAVEITRVTGSGANGFRAYFKVIVTGHNGSIGNGINIKEFYWDGGTSAPVQISTYTSSFAPAISFDTAVSNRLVVLLASSNGSASFNGVMKIEWMLPIDFASSTYTLS
jgi:hypothetical protein